VSPAPARVPARAFVPAARSPLTVSLRLSPARPPARTRTRPRPRPRPRSRSRRGQAGTCVPSFSLSPIVAPIPLALRRDPAPAGRHPAWSRSSIVCPGNAAAPRADKGKRGRQSRPPAPLRRVLGCSPGWEDGPSAPLHWASASISAYLACRPRAGGPPRPGLSHPCAQNRSSNPMSTDRLWPSKGVTLVPCL
jgi:hypothetical protein